MGVRRRRRGTAEGQGMGVGLEVPSCVAQRSGPAGGQPCPPHIPSLPLVLPLPAGLASPQTISCLCLLFALLSLSPVGSPLCWGLLFCPLLCASSWGSSEMPWKSPIPPPTPPPADIAFVFMPSLPTVTDIARLNLQHLEITLAFLSKMNTSDCHFIFLSLSS